MNEPGQPEAIEPPRHRRRGGCCFGRLVLGCALVIALVLGAGAGALYLGWPQKALLRMAASGMDMVAAVGAVRTTPASIELASLHLHRRGEPRDQPVLKLEGLRIDLSLFDPATPPVTAVAIETLGLWLDADDFPEAIEPSERAPRTPRERLEPTEPFDAADFLRYLPHSVRIGRIEGGYRQDDFTIDGGPVAIEMSNRGDGGLDFVITGAPRLVVVQGVERFEAENAQVDMRLAWSPDLVTVTAKAALPPWAELDADARFVRLDEGWEGLIEIASARIDDLPAQLRALIPMDADAERIMVAPSRIAFAPAEDGYALGPSSLSASATALRLGPEDEPWFWGDPAIEMTGEGERFQGKVTHDDARSIDFDGKIGADMGVNIALSDWSYADLEALTPVALLEVVALFSSLHRLDARMDIAYRNGTVSVNAAMTPAFGLDPAWHDQLRLDAAFAVYPEQETFEGVMTMQLAGDAMVLNASNGPNGGVVIDAMMHDFDLPRLAQLLALAPPEVRDLESLFSGTAHMAYDERHAAMRFDLEVSPPPFLPFETLRSSSVKLHGDISAPPDFAGLSGKGGFSLDPHITLDAAALQANLEASTWSTTVTGAADLGALAAYLDLGPIAGDLTYSAPVRGTRDAIETDFSIAIDGPAFYGAGLGYGDLLSFHGTARYPFEGDGTIRNLLVTAGEGTRVTAPGAGYTATPMTLHVPSLTLASDGLALISAGYLDAMTGTLDATGSLDYGPDGYALSLDYTTRYDLLTLRNALAVISGGEGEGHFELSQDGLGGEGVLTATELAVFGVTLERVRVPIAFEGDALRVREFEAGLFNGRVLTNGRIGLLEDGMPVELVARLRSVDLGPFSDAFLSPETRVTGIANGTVRIQTQHMQVTGFEASLRSARDFSINRDFLAQLIMQEQVGEAAGRAVSSVLAEVLGEARQRPFDVADIELALRDGLIRGTARLQSASLNLTVNLTMDPRHVGELIRMNQRSELERLRKD